MLKRLNGLQQPRHEITRKAEPDSASRHVHVHVHVLYDRGRLELLSDRVINPVCAGRALSQRLTNTISGMANFAGCVIPDRTNSQAGRETRWQRVEKRERGREEKKQEKKRTEEIRRWTFKESWCAANKVKGPWETPAIHASPVLSPALGTGAPATQSEDFGLTRGIRGT